MWSLLAKRYQLTLIIASAFLMSFALQAVLELVTGSTPTPFKVLSLVVTLVGTILTGLLNIVWRPIWRWFPAIQRFTFPDLNGTWEGNLISTWVDPETKQLKPPIPTVITIRQNLFSTSVSLKTGESTSHSTRSFLEAFREIRKFRIWYSYNNDPQAQFQHRSSPHEGVAFLDLDYDADQHRLAGRYYTARKTTGDIDVSRKRVGRPRKKTTTG